MLKKLKLTVAVKTFSSLGKGMATHSSILAWRIPGTKDYGRVQSMGSQRVGHDWSSLAWRPTISSRTNNNNKKDALFIIGDWNAEVGSQEIPGVTGKFGLGVQNEAGQGLTEFCQENALVITNTLFQKHKMLHMDIIRWSILKSDWLYSLQPKIVVSKNKTCSWLWLRSSAPYCKIQT